MRAWGFFATAGASCRLIVLSPYLATTAAAGANFFEITYCWAIDSTLFTTQYSTRPDGKKKNMTENASGMNNIIFACIGSAGAGFSLVVMYIEIAYSTGRMYQGSGAARLVIQPIHGAPRISTDACSTQYRAMKTGICTRIGRQLPSGLIFSVLYSSMVAWFILAGSPL